jgi:hypothetical protein
MERVTAFPGSLPMLPDDSSHRCPAVHQSPGVVITARAVNAHTTHTLPLSETETSQEHRHASEQNDELLTQAFHFRSLLASDFSFA